MSTWGSSPLTLTSIPIELLLHIADYLSPEDLFNLHLITPGLRASLRCHLHRSIIQSHSNNPGLALWAACQTGHSGVARFLLDFADRDCIDPIPIPDNIISYANIHDETALITAVRGDRSCITRIFHWDDYEPEVASRRAEPLISPEKERREEIVRLLLIRGADFDKVDDNLKSALHYSCQYGDTAICRLLLLCGAKAAVFDYGHLTPLHLSVYCNRLETLEVLLGFDSMSRTINHGAEENDTALHMASEGGYTEVVEVLLAHGADFTLCNSMGESPLHRAAMTGKTEVVRTLLGHGANADTTDSRGFTPLDVAETSVFSNDEVRQLLRDAISELLPLQQ